jgi:hypothetical protein
LCDGAGNAHEAAFGSDFFYGKSEIRAKAGDGMDVVGSCAVLVRELLAR